MNPKYERDTVWVRDTGKGRDWQAPKNSFNFLLPYEETRRLSPSAAKKTACHRGPGHTGALILNLKKKKVSRKDLIGQWMGGEERMWAGQMEERGSSSEEKCTRPREGNWDLSSKLVKWKTRSSVTSWKHSRQQFGKPWAKCELPNRCEHSGGGVESEWRASKQKEAL